MNIYNIHQNKLWNNFTKEKYIKIYLFFDIVKSKEKIQREEDMFAAEVYYYFFENRFEVETKIVLVKEQQEELINYARTILLKKDNIKNGEVVYSANKLYYQVWKGIVKENAFGVSYIEYENGYLEFLIGKENFYVTEKEAKEELEAYIQPEYDQSLKNDEWIKELFGEWMQYNSGRGERFLNKRRAFVELIKEKLDVDVEK